MPTYKQRQKTQAQFVTYDGQGFTIVGIVGDRIPDISTPKYILITRRHHSINY
jgi:hypothetical protein